MDKFIVIDELEKEKYILDAILSSCSQVEDIIIEIAENVEELKGFIIVYKYADNETIERFKGYILINLNKKIYVV